MIKNFKRNFFIVSTLVFSVIAILFFVLGFMFAKSNYYERHLITVSGYLNQIESFYSKTDDHKDIKTEIKPNGKKNEDTQAPPELPEDEPVKKKDEHTDVLALPEIDTEKDSVYIAVFNSDLTDSVASKQNSTSFDSSELEVIALELAEEGKEGSGELFDRYAFYTARKTGDYFCVVIMDITVDRTVLSKLSVTLGIVLIALLLLFGALFFFMSGIVAKPVERSFERQKRFIADASHELKTPLTIIQTDIAILMAHGDDTIKDQIKWVSGIGDESRRMGQLVADMLFLAKCDAEQPKFIASRVNLSDIIIGAALPFESVAFEKKMDYSNNIEKDVSALGDSERLRQLAVILIDNAFKYTGENGKINITLTVINKHPVLTVSNTGSIIPPEHRKHLFERFYKVDSSRSGAVGGYGLGLSIAKEIADMHKAKIIYSCPEDKYNAFTVEFEKIPE